MHVGQAAEIDRLTALRAGKDGQTADGLDIVPVAVVLGQITETLVGVEEQVLVPAVLDAVDVDAADLKADGFEERAMPLAARAERNPGTDTELLVELLEDLQFGCRGIDDGAALDTDGGARMFETAQLDDPAAVGAG